MFTDLKLLEARALRDLIDACLDDAGNSTPLDWAGDDRTWCDCDDLVMAGWGEKSAKKLYSQLKRKGYVVGTGDDDHVSYGYEEIEAWNEFWLASDGTLAEMAHAYNDIAKALDEELVFRFSDKKNAWKRLKKLVEKFNSIEAKVTECKRGEGQYVRSNVLVDGVKYRSVAQAFKALDLPMGEHIKFRMDLKAHKTLHRYTKKWEIIDG